MIEKAEIMTIGEGKKTTTYLAFAFEKSLFIKKVLSTVFRFGARYGCTNDFKDRTVLIEFSSPNIAKPFHVGHLRSTIIGNFLRNLYKMMGANTIAINYLGDWGTQFGLLARGFEQWGSELLLEAEPIRHLFDIYVKANTVADIYYVHHPSIKKKDTTSPIFIAGSKTISLNTNDVIAQAREVLKANTITKLMELSQKGATILLLVPASKASCTLTIFQESVKEWAKYIPNLQVFVDGLSRHGDVASLGDKQDVERTHSDRTSTLSCSVNVENKHVILLDNYVMTGTTLSAVGAWLKSQLKAESVSLLALGKTDDSPLFKDAARANFKRMEEGDEYLLNLWRRFRDLSIEAYKAIYERLNVSFDVYSGESQMTHGMMDAVQRLDEKGLLQKDKMGAAIVDLEEYKMGTAMIKKSDGATLYITRDLAAAKSRFDQYHFDKSIYVVAAQQDLHFQQLFKMLDLMDYEWANPDQQRLLHINFGMVLGMSTRRGTVVFLEDILNEARAAMLNKMKDDRFKKMAEIENPEKTADMIGLSAIVVQDMSAKRIKDYTFDWKRMTNFEGNTGPYLQYTHARLCCMEDKTVAIPLTDNVATELIASNTIAVSLTVAIARFPLVLQKCVEGHEPSVLISYLFELCHALSSAHASLKVLGAEGEVAKARKLLFWAGRMVLHNGLILIGLTPLTRI